MPLCLSVCLSVCPFVIAVSLRAIPAGYKPEARKIVAWAGEGQSSSTIQGDCMVREGGMVKAYRVPVVVHYTVRGRVKYNPSDFGII